LKQLVTGKKTRKDHPQVMNAAVRLYADAANAKTKMENGFDLTDYDERTLAFAKDYSNQLLAIDVNLDTTEMLDVGLGLVWQVLPSGRSKYQERLGGSILAKRRIIINL